MMRTAEKEGYRAYVDGGKNPYSKRTHPDEHFDWACGWEEAKKDQRNNELSRDHIAFEKDEEEPNRG